MQAFQKASDSAKWLKPFHRRLTMSTIPTSVTEAQFEQYIRPYLKTAQRGYECKIALYKIFNYILKRLHTGCQWSQLPIASSPSEPEKKKLAGRRFTITGKNGIRQAILSKSGCIALSASKMN
jgi:hypothetical protein